MSEAEIQGEILETYRRCKGLKLWRSNTGAARIGSRYVRFGIKGGADVTGILAPSGRAVFIEVKSATGRQSPEQKAFEKLVTNQGALYILARSVIDVRSCYHCEYVECPVCGDDAAIPDITRSPVSRETPR